MRCVHSLLIALGFVWTYYTYSIELESTSTNSRKSLGSLDRVDFAPTPELTLNKESLTGLIYERHYLETPISEYLPYLHHRVNPPTPTPIGNALMQLALIHPRHAHLLLNVQACTSQLKLRFEFSFRINSSQRFSFLNDYAAFLIEATFVHLTKAATQCVNEHMYLRL